MADIQDIVPRPARRKGISVLLTDHNVRETLAITDRSYIIFEGRILRHGPSDDLVNDPLVRQVYLGEKFQMPELTRDEVSRHGHGVSESCARLPGVRE